MCTAPACFSTSFRAKTNIPNIHIHIRFEFVRDNYYNLIFEITVKMVESSERMLLAHEVEISIILHVKNDKL